MVSRFDCRWILAHPLRWLRIMLLPWVIAVVLIAKGVIVTHSAYGMAALSGIWPTILYSIAVLFLVNSIAPLDRRLTSATAAITLAVAILRMLTYAEIVVTTDGSSRWLAAGFGLHWLLITFLVPWWPALMESCGRALTVEAGRGDRGTP